MAVAYPCGWSGEVRAFLEARSEDVLSALAEHHRHGLLEEPGESQGYAWRSSIDVLKRCFEALVIETPRVAEYGLVFEYELPRERGRRPDVVLLSDRQAFVLEFKEADAPSHAYVDQAAAYARDLAGYHAGSRGLRVVPVLMLVRSVRPDTVVDGVDVVSGRTLPDFLRKHIDAGAGSPDLSGWLNAAYAPLPGIVEAARSLFHREPLPVLERARSAGIPEALKVLTGIAARARAGREHHLAIVTGVPGSGKTLLGLQLAYREGTGPEDRGLFLSGNGPLVEVLQHALKSKVFIQDVHGFLKTYGGNSARIPDEHILVYDEAQRAWDRNKAREKRGAHISQPEDFVRISERGRDWGLVAALIGEGQEIHVGEEGGLKQWDDALGRALHGWTVHVPARLGDLFTSAGDVLLHAELDLTVSLRSHLAEDVTRWVDRLLEGDIVAARAVSRNIRAQGFGLYLTRDLHEARDYLRTRYADSPGRRYGLVASSKARDLEFYGIKNDYYSTRKVNIAAWYNSEPGDPSSCCALTSVVTEFGCQGLELDFPVACWGSDMMWDNGGWRTPIARRINAVDPRTLRLNSYRVLLTRGRDGLLLFVPPARRYEPTVAALAAAGAVALA